MDIRQLYYAIEVANQFSYTKAANAIHISQPNLSQQISKLEDELGFNIFNHSTRSVQITTAGRYFLANAQDVTVAWEKLLTSCGKYSKRNQNNLVIAMYPSMKYTPIIDLTDAYIVNHPDIIPEIRILNEEHVSEAIQSGDCDIAFIEDAYFTNQQPVLKEHMDNLILTPVYDDSIGVIINTRDPLAYASVIRKNQLQDYKIICKRVGNKITFERIQKIFSYDGIDIQRPFALTDDPDVMILLLKEPGRVAFTNFSVGSNIVKNRSHLKCIKLETCKNIISYMVMRREDMDFPIIKHFYSYLKTNLNYK